MLKFSLTGWPSNAKENEARLALALAIISGRRRITLDPLELVTLGITSARTVPVPMDAIVAIAEAVVLAAIKENAPPLPSLDLTDEEVADIEAAVAESRGEATPSAPPAGLHWGVYVHPWSPEEYLDAAFCERDDADAWALSVRDSTTATDVRPLQEAPHA